MSDGQAEACINRMDGMQNFLRFIGGEGKIVFDTILAFLRTVKIAAQSAATTSKEYFAEAGVKSMGSNFEAQFLRVEIPATSESELAVRKLTKNSLDASILMDNVFSLHKDLINKTYKHGPYHAFNISDPKPRNIHKATVRDRLLHHAVYRVLYPYFDKKFIFDSYSCRLNKGTHKAMNQFRKYFWKVSKNNTRTCWVLKCDVKKFFASIDHTILLQILEKHIEDKNITWLLERIISSFVSRATLDIGLPLRNLTSQLLVNVYMNEFDQYVKHRLRVRYYIRYAGDFLILSENKSYLCTTYQYIVCFLRDSLKLELHPDKVFIKTFSSGIDFLGWVHFPDHRVLRTTTKRRTLKRVSTCQVDTLPSVCASYLGMLKHGNTHKIRKIAGGYGV